AQAETAVATVQELVGRMDREIDELAARGAVSPSLTNREGPVVNLTGDGVRSFDHGLVGLLPETIVWILAPQVKNALAEKIRSAHPGGGLTDFERAAELAALERERLELERLEESHIIAAAEIGQHIARRRDADPRAILEIE
ncbi:MAG: hypothetical protein KDK08_06585, partial [Rhizobiaceae bacterium]|nr:hypothetical protein [Rhizobiaceae bacterium]